MNVIQKISKQRQQPIWKRAFRVELVTKMVVWVATATVAQSSRLLCVDELSGHER